MQSSASAGALVAALQSPLAAAGNEITIASLALLRELESSLEASQRALLECDLAGIEQGAQEQMRLTAQLPPLLFASRSKQSASIEPGQPKAGASASRGPAELHAAANRILALVRVHMLLLGRSQQDLSVLLNLIAGTAASYGPLLMQRARTEAALPGVNNQA
jgi:hypothetical protein